VGKTVCRFSGSSICNKGREGDGLEVEMENITDQNFQVVQTADSFRNEVGEMSEMQVYAHVRTRLGDDMEAAENVLRELEDTGRASARFNDSFGREIRIDIRRV